jgi:hypothetical protein
MRTTEHRSFSTADEVRTFPNGQAEILNTSEGTIGRLVLEPGWRWSNDVKPVAGTEWCEAPHLQYHVSGRLHVRMADGSDFEAVAGDITSLPAGHDAWVVGDEPVVVIDFEGAIDYAKQG